MIVHPANRSLVNLARNYKIANIGSEETRNELIRNMEIYYLAERLGMNESPSYGELMVYMLGRPLSALALFGHVVFCHPGFFNPWSNRFLNGHHEKLENLARMYKEKDCLPEGCGFEQI